MAPDQDPPVRPRRERPLVAAGREAPKEPPLPPTMTTPPTGPPTGPPVIEFGAPVGQAERDDRIQISLEGPMPQRRWTIALRFFLTIPHYIWSGLIGFAGSVVLFVAWFAALFTGRVPDGMASFLSSVLQYQTRVFGYGWFLLTDKYPPFELEEPYAIDLKTNPGKLNPAAVFFRWFLVIPGYIVSSFVLLGASVVGVVGWLLAIILGRLPTPLWEANAALLRYYARFQGFSFLLTAEQPTGIFGDRGPAPGLTAADEMSMTPDLPTTPRISRLKLSAAGKRVVSLFIAVSVVFGVGIFAAGIVAGVNESRALNALERSRDRLDLAISDYGTATQRCSIQGGGAACQHAADAQLAQSFDAFADEVDGTNIPDTIDASPLIADAHDCSAALRRKSTAETVDQDQQAYQQYQDSLQHLKDDYKDILDYNRDY